MTKCILVFLCYPALNLVENHKYLSSVLSNNEFSWHKKHRKALVNIFWQYWKQIFIK